ncbi:hypothetical protein H4R99_005604, partial [Coemansia sp. RSA 1722]
MAGSSKDNGGSLRPNNPFGNYSFMEAQQQQQKQQPSVSSSAAAASSGSGSSSSKPRALPAVKESPFGNYSFKEAQQQQQQQQKNQQQPGAVYTEPLSPVESGFGSLNQGAAQPGLSSSYQDTGEQQPSGASQHRARDHAFETHSVGDQSTVPAPETRFHEQPGSVPLGAYAGSGAIEQYAIRVLYE